MNRNKQLLTYIGADLVAAICAWTLFCVCRAQLINHQMVDSAVFLPFNYAWVLATFAFLIVCFTVNYLTGYYLKPFRKVLLVELMTTIIASVIISLFVFFILLIGKSIAFDRILDSFLILLGLYFGITYLFRFIITRRTINRLRRGDCGFNTLIIGTGYNALKTYEELGNHKKREGNIVVGFISVDNSPRVVDKSMILSSINKIKEIVVAHNIAEFFVAIDNADEKKIFDITSQLYQFNKPVKLWPRVYEILTGRVRMTNLYFSPFVNITELQVPDWEICCKRVFDVGLAAILMVLLSPVYLYLAIRVKMDSPGPVFYKQMRVGLHGVPFTIIKFRTMYCNSENGTPLLTSPNDKRITPYGRLMRKYRLDELPQFFNILKGDMAIVGPRPERKFFIDQIIQQASYYCLVYKVRPGLTSWGPIKVGYTDTMEKMVERLNYDIVYLENMSLVTDLQILMLTLAILIRGKGH